MHGKFKYLYQQIYKKNVICSSINDWATTLFEQLNFCRNSNGIMMTEYNPNYEFAGGSCTIQDLREVDRDNLLLVK